MIDFLTRRLSKILGHGIFQWKETSLLENQIERKLNKMVLGNVGAMEVIRD